jgi:hypothetical protein
MLCKFSYFSTPFTLNLKTATEHCHVHPPALHTLSHRINIKASRNWLGQASHHL